MSKWKHGWSNGEGICYLVDGSKPRSDICDVSRSGKVQDVVHEALGRLDSCVGEKEPKEIDFGLGKLKLLRVESASTPGGLCQVRTDAEEVLLDSVVP